jgi:hypothetical protein
MKVTEAEFDKDGGGLTIGSITGAAVLTIVIICIPACRNSGGPISDLEGHRLSYLSMSNILILCKALRRIAPQDKHSDEDNQGIAGDNLVHWMHSSSWATGMRGIFFSRFDDLDSIFNGRAVTEVENLECNMRGK